MKTDLRSIKWSIPTVRFCTHPSIKMCFAAQSDDLNLWWPVSLIHELYTIKNPESLDWARPEIRPQCNWGRFHSWAVYFCETWERRDVSSIAVTVTHQRNTRELNIERTKHWSPLLESRTTILVKCLPGLRICFHSLFVATPVCLTLFLSSWCCTQWEKNHTGITLIITYCKIDNSVP